MSLLSFKALPEEFFIRSFWGILDAIVTVGGQGKSEHTIVAYHRGLHHFRTWMEHIYHTLVAVTAIMPRDVRDWKAYQQTREKARPASVNQRLVALTQFFQWAVKEKHCQDNPAEGIVSLRLPLAQPKVS